MWDKIKSAFVKATKVIYKGAMVAASFTLVFLCNPIVAFAYGIVLGLVFGFWSLLIVGITYFVVVPLFYLYACSDSFQRHAHWCNN